MFISKYLPVNIRRVNAAVYTQNNVFPADLLVKAKAALTGDSTVNDVLVEENGVTFVEHPTIHWSIPDIYLACEAYEAAFANDFSFYTVRNKEGVPQLFISKYFKGSRLLINALTFQTILVRTPSLVKRISSMVDKQFDTAYCVTIFNVIEDLEAGSTRYLDAIIVDRGTETETMIVNPVTTLFADDNVYYGVELIEDFRTLLEDPTAEVDTYHIEDNMYIRNERVGYQPLPHTHVQNMVKLYDRLCAKKCNYVDLIGDDCDTHFFVSTNWRYLVNARTFECLIIYNANLKKLLQSYVSAGKTPVDQLIMCWELAKTEPK